MAVKLINFFLISVTKTTKQYSSKQSSTLEKSHENLEDKPFVQFPVCSLLVRELSLFICMGYFDLAWTEVTWRQAAVSQLTKDSP